jgi:ParB family chromosome partitioning protein
MIKDLSDKEAYEVSLVENVQRDTLNPIEEAQAFQNYVKRFGYGSTTELSRQIGKSEEFVSHRILLLSLPKGVLENVSSRQLSPTTAEELIWLKNPAVQAALGKELAECKLSAKKVRQVVKLVKKNIEVSQAVRAVSDSTPDFDKKIYEILGKDGDVKIISEATLIFKSTLIHLDSLIDRISDESPLKKAMIKRRYEVHQILDGLIAMRNGRIKTDEMTITL